jgi:hypothetical protein
MPKRADVFASYRPKVALVTSLAHRRLFKQLTAWDGAQLLKQAKDIEFDPLLRELATSHTVDFNARKSYPLASWRNALKARVMRATPSLANGHLVSFSHQILDRRLQVGKGREKGRRELPEGFDPMHGFVSWEVGGKVVGQDFISHAEILRIHTLLIFAPDKGLVFFWCHRVSSFVPHCDDFNLACITNRAEPNLLPVQLGVYEIWRHILSNNRMSLSYLKSGVEREDKGISVAV